MPASDQPAAPTGRRPRKCSACEAVLSEAAVICVNCGMDFRIGKKLQYQGSTPKLRKASVSPREQEESTSNAAKAESQSDAPIDESTRGWNSILLIAIPSVVVVALLAIWFQTRTPSSKADDHQADDHQWEGVFEACSNSGELTFSTPPESKLRITMFKSSFPAIPYWQAIPAGTKVKFRGRVWDAGSGYVAVDHQTGKKKRLTSYTMADAVPVTLPSGVDEKLVRLLTTFDIYAELGRVFSMSESGWYRERSFQSLDKARENASGPKKKMYSPDSALFKLHLLNAEDSLVIWEHCRRNIYGEEMPRQNNPFIMASFESRAVRADFVEGAIIYCVERELVKGEITTVVKALRDQD